MKTKLFIGFLIFLFLTGCLSGCKESPLLEVWVEESQDIEAFGSTDSLILHFTQPIFRKSSVAVPLDAHDVSLSERPLHWLAFPFWRSHGLLVGGYLYQS